jgi:hypothetical protein
MVYSGLRRGFRREGRCGLYEGADMSLIDPVERLLLNLEGEVDPGYVFLYISRDVAVQELKQMTGQDFGDDAGQWRQWLEDNKYPRCGGGTWVR